MTGLGNRRRAIPRDALVSGREVGVFAVAGCPGAFGFLMREEIVGWSRGWVA